MNRLFALFGAAIILSCLNVSAQDALPVKSLKGKVLPKGIAYDGTLRTAVRWADSTGDHVLVLSETGTIESPKYAHDSGGKDAEVLAYHYIVKKDSAVLTWKSNEYISNCHGSPQAMFVNDGFRVTDLDHNGFSEIWLMMQTECKKEMPAVAAGDDAPRKEPAELKIFLYKGDQKCVIQGQNRVYTSTDAMGGRHFYGGNYNYDAGFSSGLRIYLDYATTLWNKMID